MRGRQRLDTVLRCLLQLNDSGYRHALVAVTRCLAAPGRTVHPHFAVSIHLQHGIVVVEQVGGVVLRQPLTRMRGLTCTRMPEEQTCFALVHHHGSVHLQQTAVGCSKGEQEHDSIIDSKTLRVHRRSLL